MKPPKELQEKLLAHLKELGVSPYKFTIGELQNPYPIGRRNIYSICKGYNVSYRSIGLMQHFFETIKQE